jgi:flagella basal body P-ring formation protein FlgA
MFISGRLLAVVCAASLAAGAAAAAVSAEPDLVAATRDEAVAEATARLVSGEEVARLIAAALAGEDGDASALGVELADPLFALQLPGGAGAVQVDEVASDPSKRRFAARLVITGDGGAARRQIVVGRIHRLARVPVLTRPIGRGEIITAADVDWTRLKDSRLGSNTIVDAEELIGLSARRALRAGTPVRASQVRKPVVVEKGSLVMLVLNRPGMALSARGRALEDGGRGESVRVSNLQSHMVVEGRVTGPGRVEVRPSLPGTGATRGR